MSRFARCRRLGGEVAGRSASGAGLSSPRLKPMTLSSLSVGPIESVCERYWIWLSQTRSILGGRSSSKVRFETDSSLPPGWWECAWSNGQVGNRVGDVCRSSF